MHGKPVASAFKGWPEGLSDEEAIQRLQTLCLGACDGIQDLADDARYKALRKALISRTDLRPLAPSFVAAQANLESFVRYVRETKDRSARREMVRSQFASLRSALQDRAGSSKSSTWTGRRSSAEQATLVRALARPALAAVEHLIAEEEQRRDNGGPVDADREQALTHLRQFHAALGELVRLAEAEQPLTNAISHLKRIRHAVSETVRKAADAAPITTSAVLAFGTIAGLTDLLIGNLVVSVAAGGLAGNTMKDVMLKGEKTQSR